MTDTVQTIHERLQKEWKERDTLRALQLQLNSTMHEYEKAQKVVEMIVVVACISAVLLPVLWAIWFFGERGRPDWFLVFMYSILAAIWVGYAWARCNEAKARSLEVMELAASVKKIGLKIVSDPRRDEDSFDWGLWIVEKAHPDEEIKARWGHWDSLRNFSPAKEMFYY